MFIVANESDNQLQREETHGLQREPMVDAATSGIDLRWLTCPNY
jgi:hypothetical protein